MSACGKGGTPTRTDSVDPSDEKALAGGRSTLRVTPAMEVRASDTPWGSRVVGQLGPEGLRIGVV